MRIRTGLIESVWRQNGASAAERSLGAWAAKRGLYVYADCYQDDDGIVQNACYMGAEELVGNKIVVYEIALPQANRIWPEARPHYEKLIRAGLERQIENHCGFAWWEHVSR